MSFFGFKQGDLEQDKFNYKKGNADDVAVYTFGEEGYDGLGDLLQEGGDELNDETFGRVGSIEKDFDFSNPALPHAVRPLKSPEGGVREQARQANKPASSPKLRQPLAPPTPNSLEAIWDDKSPFSVLPRVNGSGRSAVSELRRASPSSRLSPYIGKASQTLNTPVIPQTGPRTLQEIEAEMLAAADQSRAAARRQQQQQLLLQKEEDSLRLSQHQREQDLQRQQILQYQQEQQHQLQIQRAIQQQHQREHLQHQVTPPPRMLSGTSQSPRFHEHQRQILLLQQQQELQQQQRLLELQEQLRLEELERQMERHRTSHMNIQKAHSPNHFVHRRQPSGPAAELQAIHALHQRSESPAVGHGSFSMSQKENMPHIPEGIQLQQGLLSDMVQMEFMREMQGTSSQAGQESLRIEAMKKILEAEKMEEKRRRKAMKIAHMARYNDLMTQSDKDFITRIQVSQLVTLDPYADDFYAQVYGAIRRSRTGIQSQDERVLKFTSGGGVGLGLAQKGGNRRPNAMLRMEQQVERIVSNARKREEEKGLHSLHSLQGALGKTSGRSYKAAPRQLLQVDAANHGASPTMFPAHAHISKDSHKNLNDGAAKEAAKLGREALGNAGDTVNLVRREPLTHREVLVALESLYDVLFKTEGIKRNEITPEEGEEQAEEWKREYDEAVDELWDGLKVMVPLETSNPHPFISLLCPSKGKKMLPRLTRHLSHQRMFTLLTLLVACFDQLDVVQQAHLLDTVEETRERADAERQSEAFLIGVLHSILPVVARADLRLVTGLLGLLLDRTNIVLVARSGAGVALLTLLLSRVEVMKQALTSGIELIETPTPEEAQQWQLMFDHMFQLLSPHLLSLFPSTRIASNVLPGLVKPVDHVDQPVWQLLAAVALHAAADQHHILVAALREKILENVLSVNKGWVATEDERQTKLANVNLFLHALGLDSSQIAL